MSAQTQTRPLATIVIVNWNGARLLPACLDGVRKLEAPFAFETVVVDNASTDGSVELLRRDYPEVRVVETGANLGFAGGNNAALRTVTTPYAVLLNNDAVPEPTWLANLLAPFSAPGGERLGVVTGKVVFMPRFLRLTLSTEGFVPGPHDSRQLGVRVASVQVDGTERLGEVLWERLTYGAEGPADGRYFWTRPTGELLVPVPPDGQVTIHFRWFAEKTKDVRLSWDGGSAVLPASTGGADAKLTLDAPRVDVINNVGGVVFAEGYGADRGYQQIDEGQFDEPQDVFTACGNGMAVRTEVGAPLGWFDDDFFLYYEDTDLSWRIRSCGWDIRYVPDAVLRHLHAASSEEWSPLFVFHVDRNRMLMLTKDATVGLALRAVGRYPLTTVSIALRTARQGLAARQRPAVRPTLLRLRVIGSYLRLLPRMLNRRRRISRAAAVSRRQLQTWLVDPASGNTAPAAPSEEATNGEAAA